MKVIIIISLLVTLDFANANVLGVYHSDMRITTPRPNIPPETTQGNKQPPESKQSPNHKDVSSENKSGHGNPSVDEENLNTNIFNDVDRHNAPSTVEPVSTLPTTPSQLHQSYINRNQQDEYTSTLNGQTTFSEPSTPITVSQTTDGRKTPIWEHPPPPTVQQIPVFHGSISFPTSFVPHTQEAIPGIQQQDQVQGHDDLTETTGFEAQPQTTPTVILPQPPHSVSLFQPQPPRSTTIQPNFQTITPGSQKPLQFGYVACTPPRSLLNLTWDSDAYRNREVETFYTPLSHFEMYNSFHKIITGYNLLSDSFSDLCLTTAFNWNDLTAVVTTFGLNKKNFKCTYLNGGHKLALECTPVDHRGESFRIYFTKSDNRSYLVAYHCWESGTVEWFTYSNNVKGLPESLKREILLHVKTLGFEPEDYNEANYEHCFPDSGNDDVKTSVGDKGRDSCNISPNIVEENKWESTECNSRGDELFYITMAHEGAYSKLNMVVNEEYTGNELDFNNLCITSKWNCQSDGGSLSAFNHEAPLNCSYLPNYFRNNTNAWVTSCESNEESLFKSFVMKTDHRTYRLSQQCWKTGEFTWTVESTTPSLPSHLQKEILEHVASLGFDPQTTKQINYDLCNNQSQELREPAREVPPLDEQEKDIVAEKNALFPKCAPPPSKFINNFYFDSLHNHLKQKQKFYIPLAGKDGHASIRDFITENQSPSLEVTGGGFCPKYEFDWKNYDTRFLESTDKKGRSDPLKCVLLKQTNNSHKNIDVQECYNKNGEPIFRSYVTLSDNTYGYAVMKLCWKSGQSVWILISSEQEVSQNIKAKVLDHVAELGFNASDYQELSYDSCPGEERVKKQSEPEYEAIAEGSATGLFPKCTPPSSYLRRHTWESSSNGEGVEFLDVAMAHPESVNIYRSSVGIKENVSCTDRFYCLRSRMNYNTNTSNHIGFRDTVSDDFTCTYAANEEWILECISKTSPQLSYRNYGIKSDNLSWILTYQCLNSVTNPASWTLWVTPGTAISPDSKCRILRTVEELGFNPLQYLESGSDKCTYSNRLFTKQSCY